MMFLILNQGNPWNAIIFCNYNEYALLFTENTICIIITGNRAKLIYLVVNVIVQVRKEHFHVTGRDDSDNNVSFE